MTAAGDSSRWKRLALLVAILFPIALHLGDATARLILREVELAIDVNEGHEPKGFIAQADAEPIAFPENARGLREGTVPATRERTAPTHVEFRWDPASRQVSELTVDGQPFDRDRVVVTRDVMPKPAAFEFVVVRLPRSDGKRPLAIVGLTAFLWLALVALLHPVFERRRALGLGALSLFSYSAAWKEHVPRSAIAVALGVTLATTLSVVGVDAIPIYNLFRAACAGLDIYQYQVNFYSLWHFEFPTFPYNPLMLEFWTFFDRPWGAVLGHTPLIAGQPYAQVLLIKLVNMGLLTLTILSVISFAAEEKLLPNKKSRWIFYLGVFNPALFYVAILFVQFDTAPLYFITLGVLLSHRFDRHGVVGPVLFTVGCAMKTQGMVLLPTAAIAFVYNALSKEQAGRTLALGQRLRITGLGLGGIAVVMLLFRILPGGKGSPLKLLLTNTAQINRAFFGYLYGGDTYVYFLFGTVTLILLFYLFSLRVGLESRRVIAGSILTSGAVIMVFNASHIYTPSTLLQLGSAITLTVALERDPLRRFTYAAATVLIVVSSATQPYGDITRVIPGREGYFTHLLPTLSGLPKSQFDSIPFTLSVAAMIAYAVLFWRGARAMLTARSQERKEPHEDDNHHDLSEDAAGDQD